MITSRFKLTDLQQWEGAGYVGTNLDVLDVTSAISVLEAWGVEGDDEELLAMANSVGRHALSVSVLGSYLHHYCGGDLAGAEEFNLNDASEDDTQAAKLGRILAGYAKNLPDAERDLLVRLSVFPKGVSVDLLGYLVDAGGEIAGALVGCRAARLLQLAERLQRLGLVYTYRLRGSITYTAHPFLREYFRELLGVPSENIYEAVRGRLAAGLDAKPENKPDDTETLDRYEALIEQTVLAGRFEEAYDLYCNTMGGGGGRNHLFHYLGDYGRILRLMSLFSEDGEPENIVFSLDDNRVYLLSDWGLAAQAEGDLSLAERCHELHNKFTRENENWRSLSQGLQNSAWVSINFGHFLSAEKLLNESLKHAEENDKYIRAGSHTLLSSSRHAMGETGDVNKGFALALELEGFPFYASAGICEAAYLFALNNRKKTKELTEANLVRCDKIGWQRDIALYHALLGLLSLPESPEEARNHLDKLREWSDRSGHMECIIKGHILAAEIALCMGDLPAAIAEAETGLNHAEGCGYGKFAIDLLLQLARIYLAVPDPRKALQNARKALDRSQHKDCQYAWGEADGLHLAGICHRELKEIPLAKKRLSAALEVRRRIEHPEVEETAKVLEGLG